MKYNGFTFFLIGYILLSIPCNLNAQEQSGKDLVELSVGEANKWANTRYLLYTAIGPSHIVGFNNERTFLIDKKTADCRFEGINKNNENIVLLFNYKTKKTKKYFINEQESKENTDSLIDNILTQFFNDTQMLFLPALLSNSPSKITEVSQKVFNADKINIISFSNLSTLGDNTIDGKISLTNKGEIKSISIDNVEFRTSATKDIGEGILLPTVFEHRSTHQFQIVAAFTEMEAGKFTDL
ncbi:hypothetical protein [Sphingobacterium faecale]|uniref:Uncharacterized protein n=1 Tax=Sphingobacterium faecale TaxID=2803775 RepID=A0ABS1R743_9SPHI|nr:hypothetical protein [Sphingobacterium faecale]MBL1409676.1 hypothetical protein [Sphingobacterium faecale]